MRLIWQLLIYKKESVLSAEDGWNSDFSPKLCSVFFYFGGILTVFFVNSLAEKFSVFLFLHQKVSRKKLRQRKIKFRSAMLTFAAVLFLLDEIKKAIFCFS
jgi:hypothetical protein